MSKEAPVRQTLATLVDDFERHGKQTAVVERRGLRTERHSYGQLATLSRRFAHELAKRGIRKGDRVLIWGANRVEWIAAFFGCLLQGVIAVPLDDAGSMEFARRVEAEVGPKLIVASARTCASARLSVGDAYAGRPGDRHQAPSYFWAAVRISTRLIRYRSSSRQEQRGSEGHCPHASKCTCEPATRLNAKFSNIIATNGFFTRFGFCIRFRCSHVFGQFMGLWIPPLLGGGSTFRRSVDWFRDRRAYSSRADFGWPRCSACTRYSAAVCGAAAPRRREAPRGNAWCERLEAMVGFSGCSPFAGL